VLESWRGCLVPVLALHFLLSWPKIVRIYAPNTMGLDMPRWDEALREVPEEQVLTARFAGYGMARYIDQHLPLSARILQFGGVPGAYLRQQIDDAYEGAENEKAIYLIWTGAFPELRPTQRHTFQFAARQLASIRLEQTGQSERAIWKIGELRLFSNGREILPRPDWVLTSRPNPWDTQLAFDGNLVTMWESWERIWPGMYLEARFKEVTPVDRVEVDSPHDQDGVQMVVRGVLSGGRSITLADAAATEDFPTPPNFLKKITAALRNMGYTHLVVASSDRCYKAIQTDPAAWGMTPVATRGEYTLYALGQKQSP
jgi:hypothetical protein